MFLIINKESIRSLPPPSNGWEFHQLPSRRPRPARQRRPPPATRWLDLRGLCVSARMCVNLTWPCHLFKGRELAARRPALSTPSRWLIVRGWEPLPASGISAANLTCAFTTLSRHDRIVIDIASLDRLLTNPYFNLRYIDIYLYLKKQNKTAITYILRITHTDFDY